MKYIVEVEEIVAKLRKVIVEADSEDEAQELIEKSIMYSDTSSDFHKSLKANSNVIEVGEYSHKSEDFEITYLSEYDKYKNTHMKSIDRVKLLEMIKSGLSIDEIAESVCEDTCVIDHLVVKPKGCNCENEECLDCWKKAIKIQIEEG